MDIIKKLFQSGTSTALVIPKMWLDYQERENKQKITHVELEITKEDTIVIRPCIKLNFKVSSP
jgi:hypothetical protein